MASVCISIDNQAILARFRRALDQDGTIASDMIEVKTKINDGAVLKIVRTECPWVISVFRSFNMMEAVYD